MADLTIGKLRELIRDLPEDMRVVIRTDYWHRCAAEERSYVSDAYSAFGREGDENEKIFMMEED